MPTISKSTSCKQIIYNEVQDTSVVAEPPHSEIHIQDTFEESATLKKKSFLHVSATGVSPEALARIAKAIRLPLTSVMTADEKKELRLQLTPDDITKASQASHEGLLKAYFEAVTVVDGYCTFIEDGTAIISNAMRVMKEYIKCKDTQFLSPRYPNKIKWLEKDYSAGTAGQDIHRDHKIFKRAHRFSAQVSGLKTAKSSAKTCSRLNELIRNNRHPLVAWVALRRVVLNETSARV